jgi:hypothetical protein
MDMKARNYVYIPDNKDSTVTLKPYVDFRAPEKDLDFEVAMDREILISVVTYNDGKFEVILKDDEGREVSFLGEQKLSEEDFEFVNEIAPACVWTRYRRLTRAG